MEALHLVYQHWFITYILLSGGLNFIARIALAATGKAIEEKK